MWCWEPCQYTGTAEGMRSRGLLDNVAEPLNQLTLEPLYLQDLVTCDISYCLSRWMDLWHWHHSNGTFERPLIRRIAPNSQSNENNFNLIKIDRYRYIHKVYWRQLKKKIHQVTQIKYSCKTIDIKSKRSGSLLTQRELSSHWGRTVKEYNPFSTL